MKRSRFQLCLSWWTVIGGHTFLTKSVPVAPLLHLICTWWSLVIWSCGGRGKGRGKGWLSGEQRLSGQRISSGLCPLYSTACPFWVAACVCRGWVPPREFGNESPRWPGVSLFHVDCCLDSNHILPALTDGLHLARLAETLIKYHCLATSKPQGSSSCLLNSHLGLLVFDWSCCRPLVKTFSSPAGRWLILL